MKLLEAIRLTSQGYEVLRPQYRPKSKTWTIVRASLKGGWENTGLGNFLTLNDAKQEIKRLTSINHKYIEET